MSENGKMKFIVKNTDTISKIERHILFLKRDIEKDITNNDLKSLEYHNLALKQYQDKLNSLLIV